MRQPFEPANNEAVTDGATTPPTITGYARVELRKRCARVREGIEAVRVAST